MGESTREPLVRLAEDGSVLLAVDRAVFFGEHDTLDADAALVRVSPARALELLDGLRDVVPELRELAAEQERAASAARADGALARTVGLLRDPLLAGWSHISMGYDGGRFDKMTGAYQPGRGDYVQVNYSADKAERLQRYAAQAGAQVALRSIPNADLLDVWVGSDGNGWINLHCQLAYYPDGRPEPAEQIVAPVDPVRLTGEETAGRPGPAQTAAAAEPVDDRPGADEIIPYSCDGDRDSDCPIHGDSHDDATVLADRLAPGGAL